METLDRVLTKYGPIAAIAIFLVWMLSSNVAGSLADIKITLRDHVTQSNFYLREICINTATTEAQRANCLSVERR